MEYILDNEVLFRNSSFEIKKTYNQTIGKYGLYKSDGKQLEASYLHIFPYTADSLAPAIKADSVYVWMNLELEEEEMLDSDRWLWECCVPANSECNCISSGEIFECDICEAGIIFNTLNFKIINQSQGIIIYEYDTEDNTYRITLDRNEGLSNLMFDYMWEESEVEQQLRWTINSYEQLKGEHKYNLNICIYQYSHDNTSVRLTPYNVSIEITDTNIQMAVTKNKIILGFDDFPYTG